MDLISTYYMNLPKLSFKHNTISDQTYFVYLLTLNGSRTVSGHVEG